MCRVALQQFAVPPLCVEGTVPLVSVCSGTAEFSAGLQDLAAWIFIHSKLTRLVRVGWRGGGGDGGGGAQK